MAQILSPLRQKTRMFHILAYFAPVFLSAGFSILSLVDVSRNSFQIIFLSASVLAMKRRQNLSAFHSNWTNGKPQTGLEKKAMYNLT